ncbi:MAG TPA: hypothetical protein VGI05_15290 [Streptosporangiaceae bacterium]
MVPLSFHDFFSGCATIAGALIGLLFVALSVSSEYLRGENARTDHQVRAGAAFSALVNTMVIALFALLPTTDLGTVGIILSAVGLGTTAALIFTLAREDKRIGRTDISMFLVLIVLYGLQLANALKLEHTPHNVSLVVNQGELAVVFFLFGIARSWQLVGAREFSLVTAAASMMHRAADNGPHLTGGQPGNAGPPPAPKDPRTGPAAD